MGMRLPAPACRPGRWASLLAFDADGCGATSCAPLWAVELTTQSGSQVEPMIVGDTVFAATSTGVLVAFAAGTGEELWRAATATTRPGLAHANGVVYASGANGVLAFAAGGCGAATCAPLWSGDGGAAATSPPAVASGVVYSGEAGAVNAFDAAGCRAATCPPLVSVALTGLAPHGLSVALGKVFVSAGTTVTALAPAT